MRGNLNRCLDCAQSFNPQWVGFLPADDAYIPHALETIKKQTQVLHDAVIWTHGHFVFGEGITSNVCPVYLSQKIFSTRDFARLLYLRGNIFGELSSYLFNWQQFKDSSVTFQDGTHNVDVNFWIRLCLDLPKGKAVYWPEFLTHVMQHPLSASNQNHLSRLDEEDYIRSIGELSNLGWSNRDLMTQIFKMIYFTLKRRMRLSKGTWQELRSSLTKVSSNLASHIIRHRKNND